MLTDTAFGVELVVIAVIVDNCVAVVGVSVDDDDNGAMLEELVVDAVGVGADGEEVVGMADWITSLSTSVQSPLSMHSNMLFIILTDFFSLSSNCSFSLTSVEAL